MSPAAKKILITLGFLALVILIAYGLYYLLTKTVPTTAPPALVPPATTTAGGLPAGGQRPGVTPGATTTPAGQLPVSGQIPQVGPSYYQAQPLKKVSDDLVASPALLPNGDLRFYNSADGKFYRLRPDGTTAALSDQVFYNVEKTTWAKTTDKAVLEYPDGSNIIYNFDANQQVSLPKHWEEFAFSPAGDEVAAKSLGLSSENRWLITTKDDGTATKLIEPLGDNADKVLVDWSPSGQTVAFSFTGYPLSDERRELLFVGLHGENFKSAVVEGYGFNGQWSPSGQNLLYSVYSSRSDYQPELWVVNSYGDNIGNNRTLLNLNTWADKCAFAGEDTLYCAVPISLPRGAGLDRQSADSIPDDLYRINLKTGLKTPLDLNGEYTVKNLIYDSVNNRLMFTDIGERGLFEVTL